MQLNHNGHNFLKSGAPRMQTKQKEINIFVKEEKKTVQKKAYEKPKLETVILFADQVLGSCMLSPPCGVINPGKS